MIIDAKDTILGRLASYASKKALLQEDIHIVNCEQIVISGNKTNILEKYKTKIRRGTPRKGPFIHRHPEKFVKRVMRGMLPYKQSRGKEALAKIKCYRGIPEKFKDQKIEILKEFNYSKLPTSRYMYVHEVCKHLGAR